MFGTPIEHGLIQKYITIFGTIFNNVVISKTDSSGNIKLIRIPIGYAPRDKMMEALNEDPTHDKSTGIILPRMTYELIGLNFDSERKLNSLNTKRSTNANNVTTQIYSPVPYNLNFQLSVYTKGQIDGTKIVEQILPNFKPSYNVTASLIPSVNEVKDINITMDGVSFSDDFEGAIEMSRAVIWTLDFTMKAYFYEATSTVGLIRTANTIFFSSLTTNTGEEKVTVVPSLLDANGNPVAVSDILPTDDFGFTTTITEI